MITKRNKLEAAERAMRKIAEACTDEEEAAGEWFWCGMFNALSRYSGYLSNKQIDNEIAIAQEVTPDFTLAYELELNQ